MTWIPTVGAMLTVTLPGEIMSAKVTRLLNRDIAIVEIGQPMAKSHQYRKGDMVPCRRKRGVLQETWEAIDERDLAAYQPPAKEPPMAKKPAPKKAAAKPAAKKPAKKAAKRATRSGK